MLNFWMVSPLRPIATSLSILVTLKTLNHACSDNICTFKRSLVLACVPHLTHSHLKLRSYILSNSYKFHVVSNMSSHTNKTHTISKSNMGDICMTVTINQ